MKGAILHGHSGLPRPKQDHLREPRLENGLIKGYNRVNTGLLKVSPQNKHFTECFSTHLFIKSTRNKKKGEAAEGRGREQGVWVQLHPLHWGMKSTCSKE